MVKLGFGTYAIMLNIVLWGILLGGVLYSHLVYFPVFFSNLPESSVVVTGVYGLNEARFWLTIHPLLILSLIVSLIANWKNPDRRYLIMMSFGVYATVLIVTQLYFLPELRAFENSPAEILSEAHWDDRSSRWLFRSWIRGTVLFIFTFPLLLALARPRGANAAG